VLDGVTSWHHHDQDMLGGHKPVPIDATADEVAGRCDFCNTAAPEFVLPARSFVLGRDAHGRAQGMDGDWSCCAECAGLIDRNQWTGLLRHVQRVWEEQHGVPVPPEKALGWQHLWRALRRNISGSIRPIA
jgi:hypothetical protein